MTGVTPCVGVWIETLPVPFPNQTVSVTPCVGVWIETFLESVIRNRDMSHPAWVCGLKHGDGGTL